MNYPIQILSVCRIRDLPVLKLAVCKLPEMIPCRRLYIIAPNSDCRRIQNSLSREVCVIAEDEFIPGMTSKKLRSLKAPGFPKMAGWYFQQFLKLQFAFVDPDEDYYLIWDADTVPLRPMRFFDSAGRMLLTKASEYHLPYFETYRTLFGIRPCREFSFITQHMLIQKSVAREMLSSIEQWVQGHDSWPWKIMRSLPFNQGNNLFSEYETYGHYIKNHYPERIQCINRQWLRELPVSTGRPVPSRKKLEELARKYDYVTFERVSTGWRRLARLIIGTIKK